MKFGVHLPDGLVLPMPPVSPALTPEAQAALTQAQQAVRSADLAQWSLIVSGTGPSESLPLT